MLANQELRRQTARALSSCRVQDSETSTGAAHDLHAMGEAVAETSAVLLLDAIAGLGTMPLDIDGWGLDVASPAGPRAAGGRS